MFNTVTIKIKKKKKKKSGVLSSYRRNKKK